MITILRDVFSLEELEIIHADCEHNKKFSCWSMNMSIWDKRLTQGSSIGLVNASHTSKQVNRIISSAIVSKLPPIKELDTQHCLWYPLSGINFHDDNGYVYGATLYLNKEWMAAWGGMFLYEDGKHGFRAVVPTYNSIIINPLQTQHMVSLVSPLAPVPRQTVQIWGKR